MTSFWVVLALTLIVAVLVSAGWGTRPVSVTADIVLLPTEIDLDQLLFARLAAVKGAGLTNADHGRFTLTTRRIPGWTVLAMVVTFPIGLLFLLVRSDRVLHLSLVPTSRGQVLRVTGTVEAQVWRRVSRALAPLVADRQPALDALETSG